MALNTLGQSVHIVGELRSDEDLLIEGRVEGTIHIEGVGFAVTRFRRRRGGALLDLGEVSQHWITEQQAGKHSDR